MAFGYCDHDNFPENGTSRLAGGRRRHHAAGVIRVDFTLDASEFELPPGCQPFEQMDPGIIAETVFCMPIFLEIDGTNVLGFPNGSTTSLSLIGFATAGAEAVDRLRADGPQQVAIADAGWLYLREEGGCVSFSTSTLRTPALAGVDETRLAFREFRDRIARVVAEHVPAMINHRSWTRWFGGQDRFHTLSSPRR